MNTGKVSGKIVDVLNRKIFNGSVVFQNGMITELIEEEVDSDNYIIPGFVDAHVHIESSMLIPSEFARLAVCNGTVATVSDPHEIGNVLGVDGVRFMIDNGKKVPFKFFFGAPSCVPATEFETAGANIDALAIEELMASPDIWYLAEVMNYPGVLNHNPQVHAKLDAAKKFAKPIDGHAPGLRGIQAKEYIAQGITTDHECYTFEEAKEKLELGMKVIIREGSAAKNFEALAPLISDYAHSLMFCTDDAHPNLLVNKHINKLAARAIAKGNQIMDVLQIACVNPVLHYQLPVGLLQPTQPADFCVVKDLTQFDVIRTFIAGQEVCRDRIPLFDSVQEKPINQFNCTAITSDQLRVPVTGQAIKVIQIEDGQLITKSSEVLLSPNHGFLESDLKQDVLKMVVINRYFNAPPAIAFVKGFGLKEGAIASSVAHDCHNIIAVGTNDNDLLKAINLVIQNEGGLSLSRKQSTEFISLPFAGLMTNIDGFALAREYEMLQLKLKDAGSPLYDAYMMLSFCALLVIPELKLSDKGLFDGNTFSFTSLFKD